MTDAARKKPRNPRARRQFKIRLPLGAEWLFSLGLIVLDALILNLIFLLIFKVWLRGVPSADHYLGSYIQVRGWLFALYLIIGFSFEVFHIRSFRAVSDIASHTLGTLLGAFVAFNLLVFFWRPLAALTHTFPRPIILLSVGLSSVVLFLVRVALTSIFATKPIVRRALIIGDAEEGKRILRHFHRRGGFRFRLVEILTSDQVHELASKVFFHHIHEVIVTDPKLPLDQFWSHVYYQRKEQPHDFLVRVVFDPSLATGSVGLKSLEDFPLNTVPSHPLTERQRYFKRAFDICFSLFALVVTAPVMAIAALLVRLDSPGPIFYKQRRVGRYGKEFDVIKIRSMRVGAEAKSGPQIATADDPRVTKIGQMLRRSGLDELPQFFLVLIGEMSVVGPRPERPFFVKQQFEFQGRRLSVRPGVTGLAAVNARYYLRLVDKVGYDYYYLDHFSLILDIKIVFQTVWVLLFESDKALEDRHHNLDHMIPSPSSEDEATSSQDSMTIDKPAVPTQLAASQPTSQEKNNAHQS